jgi:4-amino-4-deoxy-L-arabinose transferase-like glycosyltransferase
MVANLPARRYGRGSRYAGRPRVTPLAVRRPTSTVTVALLLALLTISGAALRVHRAQTWQGRLSADEQAYLRLARDLSDRGTWGDPGLRQPFRWAPGAPVLFSLAADVSGEPVGRDSAFAAQTVVSTLVIPAAFILGALLGGAVPGLIAAAAVALYGPFVTATGAAGTEPLGALLVTLAAIALVLALRRGSWPWFAAAGAMLGLATLVRGDLVLAALVMPVLTGIAWSRAHHRWHGVAATVAMLTGVLALLVPWSVFASSRAERFVPVTDGGAANLFVGTYLPGDGGIFGVKRHFAEATRRMHPALRDTPTFRLPQHLVLDAVAAEHPLGTREASLRAGAADNVRRYALGRPLAFAAMEVRKLWRMWGNPYGGTLHRPAMLQRWHHRVLVLAALIGLAAGLALTRDLRLVLLSALLALVTLVDVAFISEARHNLRLLPVLLAAGAAGGWQAMRVLHARRTPDGLQRSAPTAGSSGGTPSRGGSEDG